MIAGLTGCAQEPGAGRVAPLAGIRLLIPGCAIAAILTACAFPAGAALNPDIRKVGGAGWSGEPKGPVKRVTVERLPFSFPLGIPVPGEASILFEGEYDDEGRLARRTYYYRLSHGAGFSMTEYTYDAVGRLIEEAHHGAGMARAQVTRHTYNNDGRKAETVYLDSRNEVNSRVLYDYDNLGRKTSEIRHHREGMVWSTTTYSYDENRDHVARDKPREVAYYDKQGQLTRRISYEYNDEGKLISYVARNAQDIVESKTTYTYDVSGDLLRSTSEVTSGRTTSRYNQHGDVAEVVMHDGKGNLLVRSVLLYAYDKHGNWTLCLDFRTTLIIGGTLLMTPYEFTRIELEYQEGESREEPDRAD